MVWPTTRAMTTAMRVTDIGSSRVQAGCSRLYGNGLWGTGPSRTGPQGTSATRSVPGGSRSARCRSIDIREPLLDEPACDRDRRRQRDLAFHGWLVPVVGQSCPDAAGVEPARFLQLIARHRFVR